MTAGGPHHHSRTGGTSRQSCTRALAAPYYYIPYGSASVLWRCACGAVSSVCVCVRARAFLVSRASVCGRRASVAHARTVSPPPPSPAERRVPPLTPLSGDNPPRSTSNRPAATAVSRDRRRRRHLMDPRWTVV